MSMQITNQVPVVPFRPALLASGEPSKSMVERIVDNTVLSANYLASGLSGGVAGTGAYGRSVVGASASTVASAYTNFLKAETIGPNLKIIGSLLLAPAVVLAAAVALPVSIGAGIYQGAKQVDSSKPREFTVGDAAVQGYQKTREGWQEATKSLKESLDDLGNEKLDPGEKPVDIPLIKTAKTLAVGVASVALGGVAGVMCAIVGTGRQIAGGVARAFTDENLNLPGRVLAAGGAVVGGVAQGVTYGAASALSVVGKGIAETWKEDSLAEGASAAFDRASRSVAAAASPGSLLQPQAPTPPTP